MNTRTSHILPLALFAAGTLFFSACKKEEERNEQDYSATRDNNAASSEFDELNNVVQDLMEDNSGSLRSTRPASPSARTTVTYPDLTFDAVNDSIIVDFGPAPGVTYPAVGGRTRQGKIKIHYTGPYSTPGSVITTTTENYYADGIKVEGTKVVTNSGLVSGKLEFDVEVTGAKLTYSDNSTITWSSSRTRRWETGSGTPANIFDDVLHVWGTANGTSRTGRSFTMSVPSSDPLIIDLGLACYWTSRMPNAGTLTISPAGLPDRVVDYSAGGGCDRTVFVTIGAFSATLFL